MALKIDLGQLWNQVRRVTSEQADFQVNLRGGEIEPIDLELEEGKEVDLDEIGSEGGLLVHRDRQVLLYIRDHGGRISSVVDDPWKGNRFHVAHCQKLDEMRRANRFQRYVATNNLSGIFHIIDEAGYSWPREGHAALKVCQFCVTGLNYKNARSSIWERRKVAAQFLLSEFFSIYSSCFIALPQRWDSSPADKYTDNWDEMSRVVREERSYRCEQCNVRLVGDVRLCYVHHIDGVKSNNSSTNLQVLCAACHRERPGHQGMFVRRSEMLAITRMRREQNLLKSDGWKSIFRNSDPAIHGALELVRSRFSKVPELGMDVLDDRGLVVDCIEAAWPSARSSWTVWPFDQVISRPDEFVNLLRRTAL